jgi:hypothetical protein
VWLIKGESRMDVLECSVRTLSDHLGYNDPGLLRVDSTLVLVCGGG